MKFEEIISVCQQPRAQRTLVLVTGVFDVLHEEHRLFLQKARRAGDILLVGVEADNRVKRLKGPQRPINSALQRVAALIALGITEYVFVLPEKFDELADYRLLLAQLKPDILAVSSHTNFQEVKQQLMAEIGGRVEVVHPHNPAISTTILLEQAQSE